MTTVTIHYRSPKNDPGKLPRPHHVAVTDDGQVQLLPGGEIGPLGELIGFTLKIDIDFRDTKTWVTAKQFGEAVASGQLKGDGFKNWRVAFMDMSKIPFTYIAKIDRIEVSA